MDIDNVDQDRLGPSDLLQSFRAHYHKFVQLIQGAIAQSADSVVLERLGDDLAEYISLVNENSAIFADEELATLQTSLAVMQNDIRLQYNQMLDASHHGRPSLVAAVHTGRPGRPRFDIDPEFLRWAYSMRSTSSIARFLGVSRARVRNALLEHGIAEAQQNPFTIPTSRSLPATSPAIGDQLIQDPNESAAVDDLLDPSLPLSPIESTTTPSPVDNDDSNQMRLVSFTAPVSSISDDELDGILMQLRVHYRRAGITMLHGMLLNLGHRVPRERLRMSLMRIDPVQRVFQRIRIRRRVYSVPGPNALWHHDGQHGLIRWGIVIHGFIDGYSRLITGLRASNNNRAQTVLDLFLNAAEVYGIPSRLRGDHGVENLQVAAWMESVRGERRGSYIWGRSVHNVRIERLWVDVTAQVGATWGDHFSKLEMHYGLDINNTDHIWLLHFLFLETINNQLSFFAESWNHHRMQIRNGPNRSPADMFGFDMFVHGVRGDRLELVDDMPEEELEVFGVDWAALQDDHLLLSQRRNNPQDEGSTSWLGRVGPPEHLGGVSLDPPSGPFQADELEILNQNLGRWIGSAVDETIYYLWSQGLGIARAMHPEVF